MSEIRDVRWFERLDGVAAGSPLTLRVVDRIGAPGHTLRAGASGDEVRRLEQALAFLGHLEPAEVDGTWNGQTTTALESFQNSAELEADAIYGPKSHQALEIALGARLEKTPEPPAEETPAEPVAPQPSPATSTDCEHCAVLQRLADDGTVESKCRRKSEDEGAVIALQHHFGQFGYYLGTSGPNHDGVDGGYGDKTADALAAFVSEVSGARDVDTSTLSAQEVALVVEHCAAGFRTAHAPPDSSGEPESWASRLSPRSTQEETEFKRRVYAAHIARSRGRGKVFNASLPASEVATVEGRHTLRRDAAEKAIQMLAAARAAPGARTVGVVSGYRSADSQFGIWDRNYAKYFRETESSRGGASGGPLGDAAVTLLARYFGARVAAPGFSNHQDGLAIDLSTREGGVSYGANSGQKETWRRTWFFDWLDKNAGSYGFRQNTSINEPWHWEFR